MAIGEIIELLLGAGGGIWQNMKAEEAAKWDRANQERVEGGLTGRMMGSLNMFDKTQFENLGQLKRNQQLDQAALLGYGTNSLTSAINSQQKLLDFNAQRGSELLGGYGNMQSRIMRDAEGLGNQERKDIAKRYAGLSAQTGQNMTNMGLGGSTVASSMQAGVRRQETDEMGRLEDRLRQQRIGMDMQMSQAGLAARERVNAGQMGLLQATEGDVQGLSRGLNDALYQQEAGGRAQYLQAKSEGDTNRVNMYGALSGDIWNFAGNRDYAFTNSNPLLTLSNSLGQWNAYQTAKDLKQAMTHQASNAVWQTPLLGGMNAGMGAGMGYGIGMGT